MSESLSDEQLAEWGKGFRNYVGDSARGLALVQEVRRLREECDIGARRGRLLEAEVERLGEVWRKCGAAVQRREARIADLRQGIGQANRRQSKAEAERDTYKAVVDAARDFVANGPAEDRPGLEDALHALDHQQEPHGYSSRALDQQEES